MDGQMSPCIITVAITGSVPRKADNPAVPISTAEQIEATHEAYEAGAAVVHIHVRDEQENVTCDPARFTAVREGILRYCPDIIVQFSTGGRGASLDDRGGMLQLAPEMASLTTGSVNLVNMIYPNPPDFVRELARRMLSYNIKPEIELFDLSMIYAAKQLVVEGLLKEPVHVQLVLGPGGLPARRDVFDFLLGQVRSELPSATWGAMGTGRNQLLVNEWTLDVGGHCRTGFEDNVRFDKTRLAKNNAELVKRLADKVVARGRTVATPAQARQILSLA
jgi:3-keto-5-aminohexanoate cleavage enzyme